MKISTDVIKYIENVIKTAQSVGIDSVIIEPDRVRGIDENRTVVLFQDNDVIDMPFGSIGLNRISVLINRLEIAKSQDNFNVDVIIEEGDQYARSMMMKATGTKIDYRCANPETIQAPMKINDELVYRVQLNAEAVSLLQKSQSAMGSETVSFVSSDEDGISFEISDINSDEFKHKFNDHVELLDKDANTTFKYNYPIKTLLALFKQNPNGQFDIGEKGILSIAINELNIFVLPQV